MLSRSATINALRTYYKALKLHWPLTLDPDRRHHHLDQSHLHSQIVRIHPDQLQRITPLQAYSLLLFQWRWAGMADYHNRCTCSSTQELSDHLESQTQYPLLSPRSPSYSILQAKALQPKFYRQRMPWPLQNHGFSVCAQPWLNVLRLCAASPPWSTLRETLTASLHPGPWSTANRSLDAW